LGSLMVMLRKRCDCVLGVLQSLWDLGCRLDAIESFPFI
jgi:hypothetical protein